MNVRSAALAVAIVLAASGCGLGTSAEDRAESPVAAATEATAPSERPSAAASSGPTGGAEPDTGDTRARPRGESTQDAQPPTVGESATGLGAGTASLKPVKIKPRKTARPVAVEKPSEVGGGVRVDLLSWEPVTIRAGAPGELGGPGVAIRVRVINRSDEPLDLSNVVADLRHGKDDTPAVRSDRTPTEPFRGFLAPGDRALATYAFRLDARDRDQVVLLLSLDPEVPVVVFEGSLT